MLQFLDGMHSKKRRGSLMGWAGRANVEIEHLKRTIGFGTKNMEKRSSKRFLLSLSHRMSFLSFRRMSTTHYNQSNTYFMIETHPLKPCFLMEKQPVKYLP